jgi:hypothetical protein
MAKGWFRRKKGKLVNGKQPRGASQLVEDYVRPASIAAGVISVKNGVTYDRAGEIVKRFGFHNLGRHSLATSSWTSRRIPPWFRRSCAMQRWT